MALNLIDLVPQNETIDDEALLEHFLDFVESRKLTLYPAQEQAILELYTGRNVILNTPTGSGKSTMLQAVGLLEGGFGGSIAIAGTEASALPSDGRTRVRREHLGFVYQFHHLLPDFNA